MRQGLHCASRVRDIRFARSSTLRCLVIAGMVISNGLASSVTEASPEVRRARIARRVGSASAAKTALRLSDAICILPVGNFTIELNIISLGTLVTREAGGPVRPWTRTDSVVA